MYCLLISISCLIYASLIQTKRNFTHLVEFSIKATNSVYYHAKSLINRTVVLVDSIANDTIQQFNHSQLEYLLIKLVRAPPG
jgi:hypothetical protein